MTLAGRVVKLGPAMLQSYGYVVVHAGLCCLKDSKRLRARRDVRCDLEM
jgi:hypothetical protein